MNPRMHPAAAISGLAIGILSRLLGPFILGDAEYCPVIVDQSGHRSRIVRAHGDVMIVHCRLPLTLTLAFRTYEWFAVRNQRLWPRFTRSTCTGRSHRHVGQPWISAGKH